MERRNGHGGRRRAGAGRPVSERGRRRAARAPAAQAPGDRAPRVGGRVRRVRAHPAWASVAGRAPASPPEGSGGQIGRAAGRGRGEISGVGGSLKKKKNAAPTTLRGSERSENHVVHLENGS